MSTHHQPPPPPSTRGPGRTRWASPRASSSKASPAPCTPPAQGSVDADGHPVHAGDMVAQVAQCLDNVETCWPPPA